MAFTAVSDLIISSYRAIQAIQGEDNPSSAEYDQGLDLLNVMMRSWSTDYSIPNVIVSEAFTLPAGEASRTIGTGGNWSTSRPMAVLKAQARLNDVDTPIEVVARSVYFELRHKTQGGPPYYLWYEGSYPLADIAFWPVPDTDYTILLTSQKQFGDYASISTLLDIPEELHEALKYNLCIRLGADSGVAVDEIIVGLAGQAMRRLQSLYHLNQNLIPKPCSYLIV